MTTRVPGCLKPAFTQALALVLELGLLSSVYGQQTISESQGNLVVYNFLRRAQKGCMTQWCIPIIPELGKLRQEDCCGLEAGMSYL